MARAVVLLRGINVGAHNRIKMPALVEVLEGIGCTDVGTYVQSGNAVVTTALKPAALEVAARHALAEAGLDVPVMVRTRRDLDAVVAGNPFPDAEPKLLHVAFLSGKVKASDLPDVEPPEAVAVGPARTLYIHYALGVHQSKIGNRASEKRLGVDATARNWTTTLALQALLSA